MDNKVHDELDKCYQVLKCSNSALKRQRTKNDIEIIQNKIIEYCKTSQVLNGDFGDTKDEDGFIFLEYCENKKEQYKQIETELIGLKNTFIELEDIVNMDDGKLNTINTYITHAKDQVGHADLEIVFAEKSYNDNTYYKYIIATFVSAVIVAFKCVT